MKRATLLLLAGLGMVLGGCSSMGASGNIDETCVSTVTLRVSPYSIPRGEAVEITVTWETDGPLSDPTATLFAGEQDQVAVDVSLSGESSWDSSLYSASLLNPFGTGAPAGAGWVLAEAGDGTGCGLDLSATTAFVLR